MRAYIDVHMYIYINRHMQINSNNNKFNYKSNLLQLILVLPPNQIKKNELLSEDISICVCVCTLYIYIYAHKIFIMKYNFLSRKKNRMLQNKNHWHT